MTDNGGMSGSGRFYMEDSYGREGDKPAIGRHGTAGGKRTGRDHGEPPKRRSGVQSWGGLYSQGLLFDALGIAFDREKFGSKLPNTDWYARQSAQGYKNEK